MFAIYELKNKAKTKGIGAHLTWRSLPNGDYRRVLQTSRGFMFEEDDKEGLEAHINEYGSEIKE